MRAQQRPLLSCGSMRAGGVGLAVFGSYAKYTGVANCILILLAFIVGQGAYLGSEYWLITWAYRCASHRLCTAHHAPQKM